MKLRFFAAILIFISAYTPLSLILIVYDWNGDAPLRQNHPILTIGYFILSILSCIILWFSLRGFQSSDTTIKIKNISNRSTELLNYSIPYMISFFVTDLNDGKVLLNFIIFMILMGYLTYKTHNLFLNPILVFFGYNLFSIRYERDKNICEGTFIVKGKIKNEDKCHIVSISESLNLIIKINPEV